MFKDKIKDRSELAQLCNDLKGKGKRIGFTSGVFDILHPGHVSYLEDAKSKCDVLIVGVNSDNSVKNYKDPSRPICVEIDRTVTVAGLASVDYVFIFEETNNSKNIELLKPHVYIKGGDYEPNKLESAPLVKSYGGEVVIIPFLKGYSSSSIIERIERNSVYWSGGNSDLKKEKARAVFVDRDGTIIELVEYLHDPEKMKIFSGSLSALKKLKEKGFKIIIVTNQPGIGLGYFPEDDFFKVNKVLFKEATKEGLGIDKIYFCPHSKSENCKCRKPEISLIKRGETELNVDISQSFMIGDMTSDIQTGINAGCKTILVKTGMAGEDGLYDVKADFEAKDLIEAVNFILKG